MHEIGIAEDILRKILENPKAASAKRIKTARVEIGEMHLITKEELEFAFEIVSKGTIADGANILIKIIPIKVRCSCCKKDFSEKIPRLDCPSCGSTNIEIISGRQLQVTEVEV